MDELAKHGWGDATASHHSGHLLGGGRGGKRRRRIIVDIFVEGQGEGCGGASLRTGGGGWGCGRADAELAAAVLLVVEGVFVEELVAAVLKTAFTPVLWPEEGRGRGGGGMRQCRIIGDRGGEGLLGLDAGSVDLVEVFPSGGGEGGGEVGDAKFLGFESGGEEA